MRDFARFQKGRADSEHSAVNAQKSPCGCLFVAHAVLHANDWSLFRESFAQRLNRGGGLRRFDREDNYVADVRSDVARMSDHVEAFDHEVARARLDETPAAIDRSRVVLSGDQNHFRATFRQTPTDEAANRSRSVNDESHQISSASCLCLVISN